MKTWNGKQNVNIMELREVITVSMSRKRRVSRGLQLYWMLFERVCQRMARSCQCICKDEKILNTTGFLVVVFVFLFVCFVMVCFGVLFNVSFLSGSVLKSTNLNSCLSVCPYFCILHTLQESKIQRQKHEKAWTG